MWLEKGGLIMNKTEFGSYIKESRLKKNYTQKELAELLFIDVSAVSKWERGVSYPDITLIPDICKILDISEHELISASSDREYRKMKKDAKTFNRMKKSTFWVMNISYVIALVVCFIVNLAVFHTLSWFFIVLTSVLCAYSFFPTFTWIFDKYKKSVFVGTTFLSLCLLFLTNSIYTDNYWCWIAMTGTLLGYCFIFIPILFKTQKNHLEEEKYNKLSSYFLITYSIVIYLVMILLLMVINVYNQYPVLLAITITSVIAVFPILFGVLNIFKCTKKIIKPLLVVLGTIFVLLLIVALCLSFAHSKSDNIKQYNITEEYNGININVRDSDVSIYKSEDGKDEVVAKEYDDIKFDVKVVEGLLTITEKRDYHWYEVVFDITKPTVKVYLSEDSLEKLTVVVDTGDVKLDDGFTFGDVNIETDTGNIKVYNSKFDDLAFKTETGDIKLYNVTANNLKTKLDTGDLLLSNTIVLNDFNHDSETGDVKFKSFDAKNMYIITDTGDVEGTILSDKIFIVRTDTGDIDVPETVTGGVCKITTDTGDIKIEVASE